jgi:mannose-1-phosphate guanylyltransferase
MITTCYSPVRCGIVLAAGEGKRLQSFIYRLRGDNLPKQYVKLIGTSSMLEDTFHRAETLIPPDRLFTVVSQQHLRFREARDHLSSRPVGTVILQPENRETGPGLLLPLIHLYKRYPQSTVVIFPSDHFILEQDLFMNYVNLAFNAVERDPSRLILLGIDPNEPDPEYGYILPDGELNNPAALNVHKVKLFIEKPDLQAARALISQGGLWNSMVAVFRTETFLDLVRLITPELHGSFQKILKAIDTASEKYVVEESYRHMGAMNFSKGVLEPLALRTPSALAVLRVSGVFWSDLGTGRRVMNVLPKFASCGNSLSL